MEMIRDEDKTLQQKELINNINKRLDIAGSSWKVDICKMYGDTFEIVVYDENDDWEQVGTFDINTPAHTFVQMYYLVQRTYKSAYEHGRSMMVYEFRKLLKIKE